MENDDNKIISQESGAVEPIPPKIDTPQQVSENTPDQSQEIMLPQKTHKKLLWLILASVVVLVLGTIGFFAYQNYQLKKQNAGTKVPLSLTPTPFPSTIGESKYKFYSPIKTEFQKTKEEYSGEILETDRSRVWWISADGFNIIDEYSSGIELNSYNCEADINSQLVFKKMAQSIGSTIGEIMTQNGFTTNQKNSSKSIDDDQFYDYIQAYENGAVKAVFMADPDCGSDSDKTPLHYTFSFRYTNSIDVNYQQQVPYLKDLGIDDAAIQVQKKIGDFAYINVSSRRTGYYIIAKLINGKWSKLFAGQEDPDCEIVEKYEIPKEIVSDCFPTETQN